MNDRAAPPPAARPRARVAVALLAILAAGGALRFVGLDFGLPYALHPDEHYYRIAVRRFAASGTLEPHMYAYGGLAFYPLHAALKVGHALAAATPTYAEFVADERRVTLYQRAIAAACGTATLLVAFLLGRRLRSTFAGLAAAALLAVDVLHVRDSHFGTADVPLGLVLSAALLFLARAAERGRTRDFVLAGAFAGMGAAMKYLPAVLAVPIVFAAVADARRRSDRGAMTRVRGGTGARNGTRRAVVNVAAAGVAMIGAFVLFAPYTLLEFERFASDFRLQADLTGQPQDVPGDLAGGAVPVWIAGLAYHVRVSLGLGLGWPLAMLALLGLAAPFARGTAAQRATSVAVLAYVAVIASGSATYARYMVPLVPVLVALAAVAVARIVAAEANRRRAAAAALVLAVAAIAPALHALAVDRLFVRETTFAQLDRWLERRADEAPPAGDPGGTARDTGSIVVAATHAELFRAVQPLPWRMRAIDWNPVVLARGDAELLIVFEHPSPYVRSPRGHDPVIAAAFEPAPVATFRAVADASRYVTVRNDFYFYPLGDPAALERAGPDIRVYARRAGSLAGAPRSVPSSPPSDVRAFQEPGPFPPTLEWRAPDDPALAGFRVRFTRIAEDASAGRGNASGDAGDALPVFLPAHVTRLPRPALPPGRYEATVSSLGTGGTGPSSPPVIVEVAPRRLH